MAIDWIEFHAPEARYRVSLPGYPFEGKRFWINEDILKKFFGQQPPEEVEQQQPESAEAPPDYPVPTQFTPSGGVAPADYEENYQAPRNELEQNIAGPSRSRKNRHL